MANQFRAKDFKRDLEGDFEPNLTNTVVFELMAAMHAASFLANYDGHPFMQPLSANKPLMYSLIFFVTIIVACASEVIPDLNHSLSLVLSPSPEFQRKILLLVVGDIILSFGTSRCISLLALHWRGRSAEQRAQQLGLTQWDKLIRYDPRLEKKPGRFAHGRMSNGFDMFCLKNLQSHMTTLIYTWFPLSTFQQAKTPRDLQRAGSVASAPASNAPSPNKKCQPQMTQSKTDIKYPIVTKWI